MDNGEEFVNQLVEEAKPRKRNFGESLEFLKSKGIDTNEIKDHSDASRLADRIFQNYRLSYGSNPDKNDIYQKKFASTIEALDDVAMYLHDKEWYSNPENVKKAGKTYEEYLAENWED